MSALFLAVPAMAQSDRPQTWLDDSDYPEKAVAASSSGVTKLQFDVTEKGRAENCVVIETSGSAALDRQSCAMILRATHFKAAKNEQGQKIRSVQTRKVDWSKQR
jgi:protein TonB